MESLLFHMSTSNVEEINVESESELREILLSVQLNLVCAGSGTIRQI